MSIQMNDTLGTCGCVDYHMADCPIRDLSTDASGAWRDDLDAQDYYDRWDDDYPDYVDPSECDHADKSWSGWTVHCDMGCEAEGIAIVKPDWFAGDNDIEDVILWNV